MASKKIRRNSLAIACACIACLCAITLVLTGCHSDAPPGSYDNEAVVAGIEKQELTQQLQNLALPQAEQMVKSVTYRMDTLRSEGVVQIVRFNKGRYYSVTPMTDGRYLFLLYSDQDMETPYVVDGYLGSPFPDKDDFKAIAVGMSRDDMIARDPSACVVGERSSYHRFSDKSILCIEYEADGENGYVVSAFGYLKEKDSVLYYLLPQDFDLIG